MRFFLALAFSAFLGAFAFAQDPAAPPESEEPMAEEADPTLASETPGASTTEKAVEFIKVLKTGGVVMIPLAALSFVAVLLIFYYMLTIRQGTVVSDKFMNAADALIRKQDYLGLIAVCNRENEAIARVTYKTLDFATKNPTASFEEVREVTEAEGSRQASILNQRITYLADVGSVAPMVGLLGTVLGMIKSFNDLSAASGAVQVQVSQGVSQALITTASGLTIGIPALIFYSIFRGKVQKMISEMEAAMTHLMALLAAQYKRANYRATARSDERPAGRRDAKGV
ncbi:MAG: MotA/TolQ/ExbB proton channel family protein [Verrucomicrobiota bacterium]